MCLSIPAKLTEVKGLRAKADIGGNTVRVDLSLLPDAKPGEYVLVHAGFALEKYRAEDAELILGYFREMGMISADSESAGETAAESVSGSRVEVKSEIGARPESS